MTHQEPTSPLETFRMNYPSIRVMHYPKKDNEEEMLVYRTAYGMSENAVSVANTYIRQLGLNLEAERTSNDSFIVRMKPEKPS